MRKIAWLTVVGALAAAIGGVAGPAAAADRPLVIWAPADRAAAIRIQLSDGFRGSSVIVVAKSAADLRSDLASVEPADAPDVIWVANSWTGDLVGAGLVEPVPLSQAMCDEFPANVLDGFRFGFDYYGIPVGVRNVALVTNLDLVPQAVPTFAQLERRALALVAAGTASVPLAAGQGARGGAVILGPLFTGLGGYIFGRNAAGSLDPYNVGIASHALLENAHIVNRWNETGVIAESLSASDARRAFTAGEAPFWLTGTWSVAALETLPFRTRVTSVPSIVKGVDPAPFLGIEGVMVTTYARGNGTLEAALSLVRRHFTTRTVQSQLAASMQAAPARSGSSMVPIVRDFLEAGSAGVAMPNIPQADLAWGPLADAWKASTLGADATRADLAFSAAQRTVLQAVG